MRKFLFKTSLTMKEYNRNSWYIPTDMVEEIVVNADTIKEAINEYRQELAFLHYIDISDNALRNKNAMCIDVDTRKDEFKQKGFVFTGKTDFPNSNGKGSVQYIDVWTEIVELLDIDFANAI